VRHDQIVLFGQGVDQTILLKVGPDCSLKESMRLPSQISGRTKKDLAGSQETSLNQHRNGFKSQLPESVVRVHIHERTCMLVCDTLTRMLVCDTLSRTYMYASVRCTQRRPWIVGRWMLEVGCWMSDGTWWWREEHILWLSMMVWKRQPVHLFACHLPSPLAKPTC
jgi:hypothetical protein